MELDRIGIINAELCFGGLEPPSYALGLLAGGFILGRKTRLAKPFLLSFGRRVD